MRGLRATVAVVFIVTGVSSRAPVSALQADKPSALTSRQSVPAIVLGSWQIVRHLEPGISAVERRHADARLGKSARYEAAVAGFDGDRCTAPSYELSVTDAEHLLVDGFRIKPSTLGITTKRISVIEVRCRGSRWTAPGSVLIVKANNRLLTVWDGVFFELSR